MCVSVLAIPVFCKPVLPILPTMSLQVDVEAVRHVVSHARAMRIASLAKMQPKLMPSQSTVAQDSPVVNICSPPQSIAANLIALGLRPGAANKISVAYERTALKFKAHVEAQYVVALRQLRSVSGEISRRNASFATAMATRYLKILEGWRSAIIDKVKARVCEIRTAHWTRQVSTKKPFNTSAIPVLERFFEYNSRPSRAEKQQLAAQMNMEYKQINTWFQNRRNRSKKSTPADSSSDAGGEDSCLPPDLAVALSRILDQYVVPEVSTSTGDQCDPAGSIPSYGPFDTDRPQHAFPVCYPPLCSYNPFPISPGARRFSTPWYRTSSTSSASSRVPDVADLLTSLDKWSLGGEETQSEHHNQRTLACVDVGFATRPPLAPLPALLRTSLRTRPRSDGLPSCCAQSADTGPPYIIHPDPETKPAPATRVGSRSSRTSRRRVAGISTSCNNAPRRRRGHTNPRTGPSPSDLLTPSSEESHSTVLDPAFIGTPYPRGKPSSGKPTARTRNVPRISRQRRANGGTAQTSPLDLVFGQSPNAENPSSPPSSLPALSRESSISSIRSVSSASTSSSESELLLTPPMLPASVLDYPVPDFLTFDLSGYTDDDPFKAAITDDTSFDDYLGHPTDFGGSDSKFSLSSALYSQITSIVPFFPDVPTIPSTNSPLLAF
ncbi:hypothetical protein DAEQUDRAFT_17624 [Daedalea quercina L-15889]|uniref:Homeobox domain-containing protein n=1 Tax=Daedalea quercina L-15889 TaxID=1314783 RepID=A0A165UJW1_9APHY|nr:hypothetical protein DAEQUDRAFT_17624 [Daedalea quercina L-15889]